MYRGKSRRARRGSYGHLSLSGRCRPPTPAAVVVAVAPPPPPIVGPPAPVKATFPRRYPFSEEELLRSYYLTGVRELDLETDAGAGARLVAEAKEAAKKDATGEDAKTAPLLELVASRTDLQGLPVRNVAECKAADKEAKVLQLMSTTLREILEETRGLRDLEFSTSKDEKRGLNLLAIGRKKLG